MIWALVFIIATIVFHQITFLGTFHFVITPIGAVLSIFIPGGIAIGILYSVFENKRFLRKISYGTIYLIFILVMIVFTFSLGMNSENVIITGMIISNITSTTIIIFVPFYSTLITKETSNAAFFMTAYGVLAGAGIGFGYASATPPAVKWFSAAKTGTIAGIVVSGFGLASVYAAPLAKWLTAAYGIQVMVMSLGFAFLVVVCGLAQFLKAPPAGYVPPGAAPAGLNCRLLRREPRTAR